MPFTWTFGAKFGSEFKNLPQPDQDKVLDFVEIFEAHGLQDFSMFPGKIAPSWSGNIKQSSHDYAKKHSLWHYHVGIPEFESRHPKYKTSDFLLHFQWPDRGERIVLVDLYSHYTSGDDFYLPPNIYLAP